MLKGVFKTKTISLKVTDEAIEICYQPSHHHAQPRKAVITYDEDQTIGENLETIKVKLAGTSFDAIIIENPLTYPFSDTIVGIAHQRIDIGLALTNMFNVPVVARTTVDRDGLAAAINHKKDYLSWHLDYYGQYKDKRNYGQEAMLTIGNGFFGLRGAYVEARADQNNYPGMYVAGLYNQNTTNINGRDVTNEDLVNLPNAQYMSFGIDNSNPFKIRRSDIRDSYRSLNLKTGALTTTMMINLATGHQLMVKATKVADMQHWHRFVVRYEVTPLNFAANMQIYAEIDGRVMNQNVERYAEFDQRHTTVTSLSAATDHAELSGQTKNSNIQFAIADRLLSDDTDTIKNTVASNSTAAIRQTLNIDVVPQHTYTFDKVVALFTSRESQAAQLEQLALDELQETTFDQILTDNQRFFARAWQQSDIIIDGDLTSQKLTRVNIFHLFVAAHALQSGQLDASVGARGLHGEAYRGHVFWDEMFVMPFYVSRYPELARQLLLYRYKRLSAARQYAASEGYQGAMFPWQSASKGDEQSQFVHLNPLTQKFEPDNSRRQRHVSLAVAYNVWLYFHQTGDRDFMTHYGLEMLLSIAQFWLSIAQPTADGQHYTIAGVMGPDEFHEEYPNSDHPGLTNNAYTNLMVAWLFTTIQQLSDHTDATILKTVSQKIHFGQQDYQTMTKIAQQLKLDINENGIIGQFEGYFNLPTLDFDAYRKKYGDISRLDRILKSEGKTPDTYQVAKQADALMIYYNFNPTTVTTLLNQMGYPLPDQSLTHNLEFYLARTTHGSTLSRVVYAALTKMEGNMDQSWKLFRQALFSDYYDIQGGTTAEGIHLGVMGATLEIETRFYGGVSFLGDQITVTPHLPKQWQQLTFTQLFRGTAIHFEITHHQLIIDADHDLTMTVLDHPTQIHAHQPLQINY